ncbi:MAG: ANTAR domain-containing protein, partial [Betaproteobacteria bacterium]|nr:ANTAR domain-containing protein [Betaproteobacteria bacterium]
SPRPIVLFTDDDDVETARMAVAAGVTAYIVDGLRPGRVRPVIEVALARFAREQGLRAQLDDARRQLVERKTVERAKGLLMKRLRVDEDEAFARLRRLAMEKGLKLAEIAQRLLDAAELL